MKDDKGGFARFAVALRVIKDEKDGEVKRSVVVMAINEEGHGDDFQDDGIDASMDTPDPKKNKSTSDTHQIFASFPGRKTRKMRTTMICLVDSAAEKVKKALRRWEEEEEEEED